MRRSHRARIDEPNMSDTTILMSVEDLINIAMGPSDANTVNFKMIQSILHILARQLRLLERHVELKVGAPGYDRYTTRDSGSSTSDSPRAKSKPHSKERKVEKREEKKGGKARRGDRDEDAADRRDRDDKSRERMGRSSARDTDEDRGVGKRDKSQRRMSSDREQEERRDKKEEKREKEGKATKEKGEKEEKGKGKEKEEKVKGEKDKGDKGDKEKGEKEKGGKEKGEKAKGEKDKGDKGKGEKEKGEKDKGDKVKGEKEKGDKDKSEKEKEKGEKEKKDKDKPEKEKKDKGEKEKGEKDRAEKEKGDKDRSERGEKGEKKSKGDKDVADKGRDKDERESPREKGKAGKGEKRGGREYDEDEYDRGGAKDHGGREKSPGPEREGKEKKKGRAASLTSINVKEVDRQHEKVLVVEKGPAAARSERTRVGSIEVVTLSQFELLETAVRDLQKKTAPLPTPALPDNEKLRTDIAKGSATLNDTMQAMQVTARVAAAEEAINRMTGLLTQLAQTGALPQDVAGKVDHVRMELEEAKEEAADIIALSTKSRASTPRKSVAIDPLSTKPSTMSRVEGHPEPARMSTAVSAVSRASMGAARPSMASRSSVMSRGGLVGVTHPEMDEALQNLRDTLSKNITALTTKATSTAETAAHTAKAVADKLDVALKLDKRITTLFSMVSDYGEQLSGFDAGLTTQMQSFQEQMAQMHTDLKAGLLQLEQVNNNAETAAVLELTERYDGLVSELDHTLLVHTGLTSMQKQLEEELRSLVQCVEMLREEKADRDEVLDGLRDKADNSRLAGLLSEAQFARARAQLEKRLAVCHDKFRRQDRVWMVAMKDLIRITENKAEIMQLLAAREHAQQQLRDLHEKVQFLTDALGDPKAAMLTRQLAKDAVCGACLAPALMEAADAAQGAPPALPALRPQTLHAASQPCLQPCTLEPPPDRREHTCHRWVGGSHTLMSEAVTREMAPPMQMQITPTKHYVGFGDDGRLYMMEEELLPCVECNKLSPELEALQEAQQEAQKEDKEGGKEGHPPPAVAPSAHGGGDQGERRVTIIKEV